MKLLHFANGGRPFANDDLLTLQTEALAAAAAVYAGAPACIVAGCQLSGNTNGAYNVAAGLLWCDGQLLRFGGQAAVTLPAQLQAGADTPDPAQVRAYQNGTSRACMSEVAAVLVPAGTATAGEFLPLDTWGALRWADVQRAAVRYMGELADVASAGYVPADYDATGKGKPGTGAWGWALANGLNNTEDFRGLFRLTHNPDLHYVAQLGFQPTVTMPGQVSGEERHQLTVSEMPMHDHADGANNRILRMSTDSDSGTAFDTNPTELNSRYGAVMQNRGGDSPHNNMPPYRVVVVRQWIGLA